MVRKVVNKDQVVHCARCGRRVVRLQSRTGRRFYYVNAGNTHEWMVSVDTADFHQNCAKGLGGRLGIAIEETIPNGES